MVDHLADGPERRHRDEVRLHETAGRILGIFEVALEGRAIDGGDLRQDLLALARIQVLQDIGGIVRLKLGNRFGHRRLRQIPQQLVTYTLVELGESLRVKGGAKRFYELNALRGLKKLDEIGKIGRLQAR